MQDPEPIAKDVMPLEPVDTSRPLKDVMDSLNLQKALEELLKTREPKDDDSVDYTDVEYSCGGRKYIIHGDHFPIDDIIKFSKSSCKQCNGKGYTVSNVKKTLIPDVANYIVLAKVPIREMSEEQVKIWTEKEKLNPLLRIMLPCSCALNAAKKKDPNLFANDIGNIVLQISYTIGE